MILFTGVVGSHPAGVLSSGISPTSICTCLGNVSMQVPMLDVYVTRGGGLMVDHCEILYLSVISTNRGLIFAYTTCDALAGLSHAVVRVIKRRRALLWAVFFPMCHLDDGTGCYIQILGTIPIVGEYVRANYLVAVQHIHLVLSMWVHAFQDIGHC
jgi:hypothetical protein